MKRNRGFKLGRPLIRAWRWVVRRRTRRRPTRYLRLDPAAPLPKSDLSTPSIPMMTKLFHWGRHLARRLRRRKISGWAFADDEDEDEHRRPWCAAWTPLLEGRGEPRWAPPPKGHLVVYVGGGSGSRGEEGGPPRRRYTVPVIYFNHPLFGELLREAEQEFGFHHPGGITIPCPAAKFERVWTLIAAASDGENLRRRSTPR